MRPSIKQFYHIELHAMHFDSQLGLYMDKYGSINIRNEQTIRSDFTLTIDLESISRDWKIQ